MRTCWSVLMWDVFSYQASSLNCVLLLLLLLLRSAPQLYIE